MKQFVQAFKEAGGWLFTSSSPPSKSETVPITSYDSHLNTSSNTPFNPNPELQEHLYGREWLLEELPFNLEIIQEHIAAGCVTLSPAICIDNKRPCCVRCGNVTPYLFSSYDCARCMKRCHYCRQCLTMGVVKQCSSLVTWTGPPPIIPSYEDETLCRWKGTLSDAQADASHSLLKAVRDSKDFLIWAVCGAGKTEVLFQAIEKLLANGKRTAIATPRTDVVIELLPRLQKAFPSVPISALYGGSTERIPGAPFVIATTHQLLRFKAYFDAIIIDEVDAFPFHHDPMLLYAVKKALKPSSPTIYLTATPTGELKKRFLSHRLNGVKIPRRYHGHPLPVPKSVWAGNWRKQIKNGRLSKTFLDWLKERVELQRPIFIFVPSVEVLRQLTRLLNEYVKAGAASVHAEDPERHQKVADFRKGTIRILVTTTILERGVTVPFADAAVFGADDHVFNESALVQISGRIGRDSRDPGGDIIFFHFGVTLEMVKARTHIMDMNKEGGV
ncbi:competence protein ComFA [Scopulibacillus darangshiensis]|uniref:Competence protein ComFA n=1 Tax=Scopulibacillus darangshiensis TaxID=442528 RepID=A0A4R2NVB1_9BACL|nr:DEAD/DEAH box helicase [Scopulibacillus darangshiensis]TCP26023.1 competence protein ComFA [Scopulibacillus darangshiensis]